MLERQRLARNGPASALLLALIFLVLSLASYDPADPPGSAVEPANDPVANPCGPVGALLAHGLYQALGWSSWVVLLILASADVLWLARRAVPEWWVRLLGFALAFAVASALLQKFAPGLEPSPPVGSGGYLGALVVAFLEGQFGRAGMLLILVAGGLFGLALCIDAAGALAGPGGPPRPPSRVEGGRGSGRAAARDVAAAGPAVLRGGRDQPEAGADRLDAPPGPAPRGHRGPGAPGLAALGRTPGWRDPRAGPPAPPRGGGYVLPTIDLLDPPVPFPIQEHEAKIHARAMLLERTLLDFGLQVRVVQIDTGPVITQFEIALEAGLSVKRINSLADDLAIALAVPSVRIVAPIPGKTTIGIEVPNERRGIVKLGEVIQAVDSRIGKYRIPLFLGKDVKGNPLAFDLADMPHLLIAGRTGTGKSVCLNSMILSILMTRTPNEVKLILIDPKVVELSDYKRIPHLMHPVVTDMKKAESLLAWACDKMDERYGFLARAGVQNIQSYNQLGAEEIYARLHPEDEQERARIPTNMPYIVIIADEVADLMMTAAKEVESHIVRLAQKSRAVGMHLIIATQKPTVDVITGLIKGNMPARIAFQVTSRGDSRVILDEMGADKLLGLGDMLFLIPGTSHIVRAQGTFVSDAEINRVRDYLERYPVEFSRELMQLQVGGGAAGKERGAALKDRDELYEPAIEIIVREGRGSCSLLQVRLGIGYGRAARLIDFMYEDGIVGEYKSGTSREVLYTWEEWEALKNGDETPPAPNAA